MPMPPPVDGRVPVRRPGPLGPRGGGVYLSRVQQTRLLDAAAAIVVEGGVGRVSACRVAEYAGMSSKTFYDLFADGEDCFLAVFSRAVDELAAVVVPAWAGEGEWVARVRAALTVLLACLDRDPALGRVVFLEALAGGPRVLARRAGVLGEVAKALEEGRVGARVGELPSLTGEGVAGAAFSVIHARLLEGEREGSLLELLGPLMATVVLPYRGREASVRELARPVPVPPELPERRVPFARSAPAGRPGRGAGSAVRPTERTLMVLAAVAEVGGESGRRVAERAGISDEAQISRMLARLESHGLVENRGARTVGLAKAWWLTPGGEEFLRTGHATRAAASAPRARRSRRAERGKPVRVRRPGARRVENGGVLLGRGGPVDGQRTRLLRAAVEVVDEHGYSAVTVAHISSRAKISRRTFYEVFADREDCLLAALRDIDAQLAHELGAAGIEGLRWRERVRVGLWTILSFFDREPVLARFCVVESARGDERMFSYREGLLARIAGAIAEGSEERADGGECPPLVAEGIAGAIVSILNTRLSAAAGAGRGGAVGSNAESVVAQPIAALHGELMALIVLPYLGSGIAQEERTRPAPDPEAASLSPGGAAKRGGRYLALDPDPSPGPQLRVTYRTALVLEAIARTPGISNLDVAHHARVNDQGQVSKLLARLERNELVQNTGRGQARGAPNQWRLTPRGEELLHTLTPRSSEQRPRGEKRIEAIA
jgi:AcrR family transcriptional regulator